jgi:adhesin HecA-like repeat protein
METQVVSARSRLRAYFDPNRTMRVFLLICAGLIASAVCHGQTPFLTPTVTIATTPLVIGRPATIQVLVTNAAFTPVPTGQITFDFGDGSSPEALAIANTWAGTSHTYTTAASFTITASYSGDSNFESAIASVSAVSLVSSPAYKLHLFGDSMTGTDSTSWPALLATAQGWKRAGHACGGCKTNDLAPFIYQEIVDTQFASTWMLGQNDSPHTSAALSQFEHAVLAQNAWLAIPEGTGKLRAQSSAVAQSGEWAASDIYATTGLLSNASGSSLTATVQGSTIYVGLSSTPITDYTVHVVIDGVDHGPVSPVSAYVGAYNPQETYGLRYVAGGSTGAEHTVQVECTNAGTSGCYVDWIGGNGTIERPNLPPYVWMGASFTTLQTWQSEWFPVRQETVRTVGEELQSDGLPVYVADIASLFNGPALPQCVSEGGVHPNECGNQIEETVYLSAMNFLATEAQRIDLGDVPVATVGTPLILDMAQSNSGMPVAYSIISGAGSIDEDQITLQQNGTVTVQADQAGNATVLPANPVQFYVQGFYATNTSLSSSALRPLVGSSVTFTATVTADGNPVTAGTVTFYVGKLTIGRASLNASGLAQLSVAWATTGTRAIQAKYNGTSGHYPSTSESLDITVWMPVAATPTFSVAAGTYGTPQTVEIADSTEGAAVYYTTDGTQPTVSSKLYSAPVPVSVATTIKAIAASKGYGNSSVASATYRLQAAPPTFDVQGGTYFATRAVNISDAAPNAVIYYTTDGTSPATSSTARQYASGTPVQISRTTTLKAAAVVTGWKTSMAAQATYTLQAAPPTFDVQGGTYSATQAVNISDSTPNVLIWYTTDGSAPANSSTARQYLSGTPVQVSQTTTLKAIAVVPGWTGSIVAQATYTLQAAAPSFDLQGGTYSATQTVKISVSAPNAVIWYSTDGTKPVPGSGTARQYVSGTPVQINQTTTLKAIAIVTGWAISGITAATYKLQPASPTFDVKGGIYSVPQTVNLSSSTPNAVIHYTTDGSAPWNSSTAMQYVSGTPVQINQTTTLKAVAVAPGWNNSMVAQAIYTIR